MGSPILLRAGSGAGRAMRIRERIPTPAEMNMSQREVMRLCGERLNLEPTVEKLQRDVAHLTKSIELLSVQLDKQFDRVEELSMAFVRHQGIVGLTYPATVELAARRAKR